MGRPKYHLWKISVSALCLLGSIGMANEAKQKSTVALAGPHFCLPCVPEFDMNWANCCDRAFISGLHHLCGSSRDGCHPVARQSSASPDIPSTN